MATGQGRGGARPGAGRPKGTKNEVTKAIIAERDADLASQIGALKRLFDDRIEQIGRVVHRQDETLGLLLRKLTQIERAQGLREKRPSVPRINRQGREVGQASLREQVFGPDRRAAERG